MIETTRPDPRFRFSKMLQIAWRFVIALAPVVLVSGCALGTTRARVEHSPLPAVAQKRSGTILVRQFADVRTEQRKYIGNKRNGFGMPVGRIGIEKNEPLEGLVTEYFAEALRQAGYQAVVERPGYPGKKMGVNAIMEGEIRTFWMDMYMNAWHHVKVDLRLLDKTGSRVVWRNQIEGDDVNPLWLGITPEFESVIRDALDQALKRALNEFSSEAFYRSVRSGN
jgi:hypothetical protein